MLSLRKYPLFSLFVVLTDIVAIGLAFLLAYWIRFSELIVPVFVDNPPFDRYIQVTLIIIPIYLLIFRAYKLYQPERQVRRVYELIIVLKAVTISTLSVMALSFIYREFSYSRVVLFLSWILTMLLCGLGRYVIIQVEYEIRKKKGRHNVLVIGINENVADLIKWSRNNPHYGQNIVGIIVTDDKKTGTLWSGVPILGSILDITNVLTKEKIDELIVADLSIPRETNVEIMEQCENQMVAFKLIPDLYGLMTHYVDVEHVSHVPLLGLKSVPLDDPWNRIAKRLFDILASFTGLFLLIPFFILITVIVKLTSKGPIFYSQERVGRNQKRFKLYKFRTMMENAERETGPTWTQPHDKRVTPIGRFLRNFNLDELPQLWNVFIGEMSLVGPRPERPHFVEQFKTRIPRYMTRHKVKSGLTGWAQIHGLRGNTSLEERIKYDIYYMENWTLMMDVEILFATLFAFKNAY